LLEEIADDPDGSRPSMSLEEDVAGRFAVDAKAGRGRDSWTAKRGHHAEFPEK